MTASNSELNGTNLNDHDILIRIKSVALNHFPRVLKENFQRVFCNENGSPFMELSTTSSKDNNVLTLNEISGVVEKVGFIAESTFKVGDEVTGLCPLDLSLQVISQHTTQNYLYFVHKPSNVSHDAAASVLSAGIRAYTSLLYKLKIVPGDSLLILDGQAFDCQIYRQLAQLWGARILILGSADAFPSDDRKGIIKMIDSRTSDIVSSVMESTGNAGVDCIIESSLIRSQVPLHDIVKCLGPNGHYASSNSQLQIDPPLSKSLFLKGASISYLFEQSWVLSSSQQGRYLHILKDLMEKLGAGQIRPSILANYSINQVEEAANRALSELKGKIILNP